MDFAGHMSIQLQLPRSKAVIVAQLKSCTWGMQSCCRHHTLGREHQVAHSLCLFGMRPEPAWRAMGSVRCSRPNLGFRVLGLGPSRHVQTQLQMQLP